MLKDAYGKKARLDGLFRVHNAFCIFGQDVVMSCESADIGSICISVSIDFGRIKELTLETDKQFC